MHFKVIRVFIVKKQDVFLNWKKKWNLDHLDFLLDINNDGSIKETKFFITQNTNFNQFLKMFSLHTEMQLRNNF